MLLERLVLSKLYHTEPTKIPFMSAVFSSAHQRGSKAAAVRLSDNSVLPYVINSWPGAADCAFISLGPLLTEDKWGEYTAWNKQALRLILEDLCRNSSYNLYLLSIKASETKLLNDLVDLGFTCSTFGDYFDTEGNSLYRILTLRRSDYRQLKWYIVGDFGPGFVAVFGSAIWVEKVEFLQFSQISVDPWLTQTGYRLGIVDEDCKVISRRRFNSDVKQHLFEAQGDIDLPALRDAAEQIYAYLHDELREFDVKINPDAGTAFQQIIWRLLQKVSYGHTTTYTELAEAYLTENNYSNPRRDGKMVTARNLTRAIGAACAANPLPILIPCHRVLGVKGKLVGYKDGINIKAYLLDKELLGVKDEPKQ